LFLLGWLILIVLLWGFYFFATYKVTENFKRNLIKTASTEAIVLDDHIERSLGGIFSKLLSVKTLSEVLPESPALIDSSELSKLIVGDLSVRSLSLLGRDC